MLLSKSEITIVPYSTLFRSNMIQLFVLYGMVTAPQPVISLFKTLLMLQLKYANTHVAPLHHFCLIMELALHLAMLLIYLEMTVENYSVINVLDIMTICTIMV